MDTKLCECGCGGLAPIATKTNKKRGWIKDKPLRFIQGHNARLKPKGRIEYEIDALTGCWIWKRSIQSMGYGNLTINNRGVLAHRFVYEQFKGTIPSGYELDHLCRNPACVNPDHLEVVSHAENCRRGARAKLNHETVAIIKQLHRDGVSINQLSKEFDVVRQTIGSVVKERSWV